MRKVSGLILAGLLSTSTQVLAGEEDWYSYWGGGISNNKYPTEIQDIFDAAESTGLNRAETSIDAFGFYWPADNNRTIKGFVVSGTGDTLSANGGGEVSLNTYLYSYSTMHFFGQEPGDGFFLRGDIGLAKAIASIDSTFGSSSASSDWGSGFLLGVGYGIPVSSESRIILGFNYTNKSIEDESYSATMFTIGGLW